MNKTTSAYRKLHSIFTTSPRSTNTTAEVSITSTKQRGSFHKLVSKFKENSESKNFRGRREHYARTVRLLARFNMFPMIKEILDHQKNFNDITNELFTSRLIDLYGQAGMFDEARKLFDEMSTLNCVRTVYSFNTLLSACIDSKRYDEMKGIVKNLPEKLEITLDAVSFNTMIKGYCKMGSLDNAVECFELMLEKGLSPNVITFNTLLWGFYSKGMYADGERVWDRMMEMNVTPSIRSCNAKLLGLALTKRVKEAVELIEEIRLKGVELDVYSFNFVIRGYVIDDNMEEVKRWYQEIGKSDFRPNEMTFGTILQFLCEKGDMNFAFEVCKEVFDTKCHVDVEVLQPVVDGLVTQAKFEEAERLVELAKTNKYYRSLKLPSKI